MSDNPSLTEKAAVTELEIAVKGISLEAISKGKQGYCMLSLGKIDETKQGGRKWVRKKVTAMEDIRANHEVIVANMQGEVKETVELVYEKHSGELQRVGEKYPLPISRKASHTSQLVTADGTELVSAQKGYKIQVHWYSISNHHNADVAVGLRFNSDGEIRHRYYLALLGGTVSSNIINSVWESNEGESLVAYLAAAYASGVYFNIGYSYEPV